MHRFACLAADGIGIVVALTFGCSDHPEDRPTTDDESLASHTATFQDGVAPSAGYAGTRDAYIAQAHPTTLYGAAKTVFSDGDDPAGSGEKTLGLLKWDVGAIDPGNVVRSASITVDVTNTTPGSYSLYPVYRDWVEAEVDWNRASNATPWQTAGAVGAQDRGTTALGTLTASTTGAHTLVLNAAGVALVQEWVNSPTTNHGFALVSDQTGDGVGFVSREGSTASQRPRLVVSYDPPSAADLFVATDGNDAWSGKLAQPNATHTDGPLATLHAAQMAVRTLVANSGTRTGPIVVDVRGGTYAMTAPWTLDATDSGKASLRVVWQAYPAEVPVLSGGTVLHGFTQTAAGRWELDTSTTLAAFPFLYVGGARRTRARTTDAGYLYNAGPVYASTASNACPTSTPNGYECYDRFYYSGSDLAATWKHLTDVEILDFEQWTMARMRLRSVDATNHIAYLTGSTYTGPYHGFLKHHRYLVENVGEALAQPGEWYRDASTGHLVYLALAGEDLSKATVVAPQRTQLLVASGLAHVSFRGLSFAYTNWSVPAAGHPSGQGEQGVPAAVSVTGGSDVVFDGCAVSHVTGWGVEFVGASAFTQTSAVPWSAQFVNGTISDVGAGGVRVGRAPVSGDGDTSVPHHVHIANSAIIGVGRALPASPGVWVGNAHHVTIEHNDVADGYNTGISVGFSFNYAASLAHDNVVQLNHIRDLGQGVTNDLGGVYTLVSTTTGNVVQNNRIHDVSFDPGNSALTGSRGYGGWGIYFDQGTSNVLLRNNLVYRALSEPYKQNSGQNNTVTNNIFAFGGEASAQRQYFQSSDPYVLAGTFTHNIWLEDRATRFDTGNWRCIDSSGAAVSCTTRFAFSHNLYAFPSGGPSFALDGPDPGTYSFAQWQALGEDPGSLLGQPRFTNPYPPADDFTLPSSSPALSVGFVPFDANTAGRLPGAAAAPTVPHAFPLQLPALSAY